MKHLILAFVLLFLAICLSMKADGPPIDDDGSVNVEHIALVLNKEQLAMVGSIRILKLEKEQLSLIRKINPDFPAAIRVISPSYQDCTCALPAYGIWTKRLQVCIALYQIKSNDQQITKDILKEKRDDLAKNSAYVYVNDKGELFLNNKLITQKALEDIIKKLEVDKENLKMVFLNLPPVIDKKTNEKIFQMIKDLQAFGKNLNVAVYEAG